MSPARPPASTGSNQQRHLAGSRGRFREHRAAAAPGLGIHAGRPRDPLATAGVRGQP